MLLMALFLATGGLVAGGGAADAAPCTYNGCLNKDPHTTGCDSLDVHTIAYIPVNERYQANESLELRYSGTCHAYWTRFVYPGVGMEANGCNEARMAGIRARISDQKLVNGSWVGLETASASWKTCGDSWNGDTGTGWSVMIGAAVSSTIHIRACEEFYQFQGNPITPYLRSCTGWHLT